MVKRYMPGGYYHIYNRGVEKRDIFLDKQDFVVFQRYLKLYLGSKKDVKKIRVPRIQIFLKNNMYDEIDLLAFSLMPNHIHLELRQKKADSIIRFMKRLTTSYVMYFNKKYNRVGGLFQNSYKAALIQTDPYLLHLSRYIHVNPTKTHNKGVNFKDFCSFPYYLEEKNASWLKTDPILSYFKSSRIKYKGSSYEEFVNEYKVPPEQILGDLVIEKE
jgi:putative transposase